MDVGGQDATEAFEDVGHSDEAREILAGLAVGKLKRQVCYSLTPILLLSSLIPLALFPSLSTTIFLLSPLFLPLTTSSQSTLHPSYHIQNAEQSRTNLVGLKTTARRSNPQNSDIILFHRFLNFNRQFRFRSWIIRYYSSWRSSCFWSL